MCVCIVFIQIIRNYCKDLVGLEKEGKIHTSMDSRKKFFHKQIITFGSLFVNCLVNLCMPISRVDFITSSGFWSSIETILNYFEFEKLLE